MKNKGCGPEQFNFFEPILREGADLNIHAEDTVTLILQPLLMYDSVVHLILSKIDFYINLFRQAGDKTLFNLSNWIRDRLEIAPGKQPLTQLEEFLDLHLYEAVEIQHAVYRPPHDFDRSADVTELIIDLVQNNKYLHYRITNETMRGDPAPGEGKRLYVDYLYKNQRISMDWGENEFWRFPFSEYYL